MGGIIHMETESVQAVARSLQQQCRTMEDLVDALAYKARTIPWEGGTRENFTSQVTGWRARMLSLLSEGEKLSLRAQREVDEWLGVDQRRHDGYAATGSSAKKLTKSQKIRLARSAFAKWWKKQSKKKKIAYLQAEHNKIAKKYGIKPVKLKIEQLKDPKGKDARGVYRGYKQEIAIDIDNLKSDNPADLLNTLAHESRHHVQRSAIQMYKETGKPPTGISVKTVQKWDKNFKNYVQPSKDFQGYRNQAVEVDARNYGDKYSNQVLLDRSWSK